MRDLYQLQDHCEVFGWMNTYWNYLAYHLLDHLITELVLEEMKQEMETYKCDLQQFRKEMSLKLFCEAHRKRRIKPPQDFREMVAEFEWPDEVTLEVVEEFRQEFAANYNLRDCAMMLTRILPGSFIVVWLVPECTIERLMGMKPPNEILLKYNVTKLSIQMDVHMEAVLYFGQDHSLAEPLCDPSITPDPPSEQPSLSLASSLDEAIKTEVVPSQKQTVIEKFDVYQQVVEFQQPLRRVGLKGNTLDRSSLICTHLKKANTMSYGVSYACGHSILMCKACASRYSRCPCHSFAGKMQSLT